MPQFEVEVETPKAVNLDVVFSNGKRVSCPPASRTKALLAGDELGRLEAQFMEARKQARREGSRDSDVDGGGIKVLTPGYDEVPVGSKKHRAMHPEEYDENGVHVGAGKKRGRKKREEPEVPESTEA